LTDLVLDASVALKWAVPSANEPLTAESLRLLKRYIDADVNLIVPDVFWAEIGNVLWKGVRQKRWTRALADGAVTAITGLDFFTVSSLELLPEALKIAFPRDRTVYDCLYVALAIKFNTELITADERLANALAAHLPVKWLGGIARHS
jgi:predicted nucleic acid-binding protein